MIERTFLPWTKPLLPQAALRIVEAYDAEDRISAGDATIVVPGARAGRRLLELLLDEAENRGRFLVPPRIVTAGLLPELLYVADPPLAGEALCRQAWRTALQASSEASLRHVFPHRPEDGDLPGLHSLAGIVERLYREIGSSGLSFEDVARRMASGDGLFDDSARWLALAEIGAIYSETLERLGRQDREAARRHVLARGNMRSRGPLWLVGIAELPLIVAKLLSAVDEPVQALVHAPPEWADQFDSLGCVRPEIWRDVEIPIDDEVLSVADRPSDQADEVVRILGSLEEERAADEITIGVLDDSLVPYLQQRLGAYGVASRYAAGTPLARTGPYRLLTAIADYLDGKSWPAAAALLRHPDVGAWIDAKEAPDIADRFFEKHIPTRLSGQRPRSSESEALSLMLERLERESRIGRLAGSRRLSEWMPDFLQLLERAYGEAAGAARTEANRRIVESCLRIRDKAAEFFGLPSEVDPSCEAPTALRILLAESSSQAVPPAADERAIELVGWLEVHLDDAPVLVLSGLNEPHLPESIGGDPFLPDSLRTALNLESNEKRYARDAYRLLAILHSRPVCRLVTGRRDGSGDPLRPSRLLFATDGFTAARRVLSFARGPGTDAKRALPALGIRPAPCTGFRLPPETEIEIPEPPQPFRVTEFAAILQDPFRWALERGLHLKEVHDRNREMDGALLGTVAHRVLHRFGTTSEADSTDPASVYRRLSELLDTAVEVRFGGGISAATAIQVEQLRWRLDAFARWQAARAADGWCIVATEAGTPKEGVPLDVDGTDFLLSGRIDRIDYHAASGRWAILDYKTGENTLAPEKTHRKDDVWVDLQLPLYRYLLADLDDVDWGADGPPSVDSAVELGYILLPKSVHDVRAEFADWDDDALLDALETARSVVRFLRDNLRVTMSDTGSVRGSWDPLAGLFGQRLLATADPEEEEEE